MSLATVHHLYYVTLTTVHRRQSYAAEGRYPKNQKVLKYIL